MNNTIKKKKNRKIKWGEKKGKKITLYNILCTEWNVFTWENSFLQFFPTFFPTNKNPVYHLLPSYQSVKRRLPKYYTNQNIPFNTSSLYDVGMKQHDPQSLNNKAVRYCTKPF